jgi:hypothetical protein
MFDLLSKSFLVMAALTVAVSLNGSGHHRSTDSSEARAVEFLTREVPSWSKSNGCFSCHNNGDAARALYAAIRKGYRLAPEALTETTAWVLQPNRWEQNKGEAGFSDKRLANIQFAASLLAAFEAGQVKNRSTLQEAARKVAADQGVDGAWTIDPGNTPGSPATYGTPLATYMALRTLKKAGSSETKDAVQKAERWLDRVAPENVLTAAAVLLAAEFGSGEAKRLKQEDCLKLIRAAQTREGGWGPYVDSPPESFDTAVVLLALGQVRHKPGIVDLIRRGRDFLIAQQNRDGSWPETTRPPGGDSYAQSLSTSGWATLALLETRE